MTELVTETTLAMALRDRYGFQGGNGPRYAYAAQVRSHAGHAARRTADFVAMDLWPSKRFALHGHEIKVSRADWLRELKDPAKADEFIPFMNHWWLVVPDAAIVREGELPLGWGLLAMRAGKLTAITDAPRRDALPLPPTRIAALLRAVAGDARNCRPPLADLNGATVGDLAAEVERLRAEVRKSAGKAITARDDANRWRDAFARVAPDGLPCTHCGKPVRPARGMSGWRHRKRADETGCAELRGGTWRLIYPAEGTEPPQQTVEAS